MNKITCYKCEFCGKSFDTERKCEEHEKSHIRDYSEASNAEIIEELNYLREFAYYYHIGNKVMGMPIDSFKHLMDEAARRLSDEKL